MDFIKKHFKEILIGLLVIFSLNRCTVACNRDTKINKQQTEIVQKDSINKVQLDSLNLFKVRWEENQKGQANYQNLATGTKLDLQNEINTLNSEKNVLNEKIKKLELEKSNLIKENKQLKEQLNNK